MPKLGEQVELLRERRDAVISPRLGNLGESHLGPHTELVRRGISPVYADDGDVQVINQKCVRPGSSLDLSFSKRNDSRQKNVPFELLVRPGDVLINSTGTGTLGRSVCVVDEVPAATIDGHVTLVRPNGSSLMGEFLAYYLSCREDWLVLESRGSTNQIELSRDTILAIPVPLPPLRVQRRIASYLDAETDRIDAMTAKLDEQVELLRERRVSVVQDVLAGFPSTGSTSLGLQLETHFPGEWGDDPGRGGLDVKCVRVADFDRATKTANDDVRTIRSIVPGKVFSKALKSGDLLVERSGGSEKKPVGSAFFYEGSSLAVCANFIEVLRFDSKNDSRYWFYLLVNSYDKGDFSTLYNQTTGIQNLKMDLFLQRRFPVHSLDEQRRIVADLDERTARIDTMIDKCTELRELLRERRAALIRAVVTGQKEV
ncbi:restriction endonuclease subunit S [Corynebacterium frankenforstense]|uniref:restriction endonuclease subunit S n=1 Tax=Corynebacterium frankenforstense TaxID=1230998 RepID=UPI002481F918|nr:restriction endonuclease subunit S [Corynebacterium frankenforstense]